MAGRLHHLVGRSEFRNSAIPKAKKGSKGARTGVGRDRRTAERHEALGTRALWVQTTEANNARTISGAEDERLDRSAKKPSGNQRSHSIALMDHRRERLASRFRSRRMPSLIGIATNGAKRLAPANQMNSSGTLWAWAALAENKTSARGARNRTPNSARRFTLAAQQGVYDLGKAPFSIARCREARTSAFVYGVAKVPRAPRLDFATPAP